MQNDTIPATAQTTHQDFDSFENAISILADVKIRSKKSRQPLIRTQLILLVLALGTNMICLVLLVLEHPFAQYAIWPFCFFLVLYMGVSIFHQIKMQKNSSIHVIGNRLSSEVEIIQNLMDCSIRGLELAERRIETQIICFEERGRGVDIIPGILVGIGTAFAAFVSLTQFREMLNLPLSHFGIVWPVALATIGLAIQISNVLGRFELAVLREYQFFIQSAILLKK